MKDEPSTSWYTNLMIASEINSAFMEMLVYNEALATRIDKKT